MNTLLLIIDLQKSFINENTKNIPKRIENLLQKNIFNHIIFTKFINKKNSNFYKELNYKGCMSEEERKIVIDTENNTILEKKTYTAVNSELTHYIKENNIDIIYLCGIDTDACVLKTALDLWEKNYNVKVIKDCCMSHSGYEIHDSAIKILNKMIGNSNIINSSEV